MAIMNRVGVLLYNIGLFLTIGILALTLKNFNLEDPEATLDFSNNLKVVLFAMIGIYYAFGIGLSLAALVSKARKKKVFFTMLMIWFWAMIFLNVIFVFLPDILVGTYTTPGWRYSIIIATISGAFVPAMGLILYQFPGRVDKQIMINEVKKKLEKEKKKASSFCPMCKYPSEKDWKHCPKCGAHFSD